MKFGVTKIGLGLFVAIAFAASPASAQSQTFRTYSCADGSQFAAAFYKYDPRFAHLQIDGRAVSLKKRFSLSGARYTTNGITLRISKEGVTTLTHAKRPTTVCSST
jgi:membrane-bound inhibitor of C-type lysozyme